MPGLGYGRQLTMTPQSPLLELTGIRKNFGNTAALRGVDFQVAAGEVHALLGQNGSGKSTLMKIAYGELAPTGGQVRVNGVTRDFASPHAATQAGIAAVAQEVPVVASLSVTENVLLGRLPRRLGRIRWRAARRHAGDVLESLGCELDLDTPVGHLGPEERQVVAIARALAVDARILIFDEPTSSLSAAHAASLFRMINELKARGLGMVFISQRLQDVAEVADRVTVMRDGVVAGTLAKDEATHDAITRLMIGRSLSGYFHKGEASAGEPALEAEGLSVPGAFEDVTFTVRAGEVLGVAGLVGCGRVELLRSIYGAGPRPHGELRVMGRPHRPKGPDSSVRLGLAMVTGDRKEEGLVLAHSVHQNLTMVRNRRLSLAPLRHGRDRHLTRDLVARLRIHPPDTGVAVAQLSGGNQQKVALAKWLAISPRVLLLDEPTRGVDVGARSEIYRIIGELRESGVAVVVSSSENPELLGICDRILVMSRGRVVAELPSDATETELVQHASGALD